MFRRSAMIAAGTLFAWAAQPAYSQSDVADSVAREGVGNLSEAVQALKEADAALQAAIDAETSARMAADDALQAQINDLQAQIDELRTRIEALEPPEPEGQLCSDILAANPLATDGVYTIDPDGEGGSAPFDAYCDMTTDGGGWTVVFQGSDPSIWKKNTGTPGTGDWSHDLSGMHFPMDEVLLHDLAGARTQMVAGISSADLYACKGGLSDRWWNGSLIFGDGAYHLGVHTSESKNQPNGYVIVSRVYPAPGCEHDKRGWGFGHLAFINDRQGWGWDSVDLGPTVFAIGIR